MRRSYTNSDDVILAECFLCGKSFECGGRHVYDGRRISVWGITICNSCLQGNWDGIVPESYPHLIPHLESQGIEIRLNDKGRLAIPD